MYLNQAYISLFHFFWEQPGVGGGEKNPLALHLWSWSGSCTWGFNLQHTRVAITVSAAGYVNVSICVTCVLCFKWKISPDLLLVMDQKLVCVCVHVCELFIMSLCDTCCTEQTDGELSISSLDKMLQYCSSQFLFTESFNKNKISWWRLTRVHLQPPV